MKKSLNYGDNKCNAILIGIELCESGDRLKVIESFKGYNYNKYCTREEIILIFNRL